MLQIKSRTASLDSSLISTPPKPATATVPMAYSAVVSPLSSRKLFRIRASQIRDTAFDPLSFVEPLTLHCLIITNPFRRLRPRSTIDRPSSTLAEKRGALNAMNSNRVP